MGAGLAKGLDNNQSFKRRADKAFLSGDFSGWGRYVLYFRGDIAVVSTGAPTPTFDLNGQPLQLLHEPNKPIEPLYYGVVTTEEGGAVVFTWLRELSAPRRFIDSLDALPAASRPGVLVQFMFAHVSNTFFSSAWWYSLTEEQQAWLRKLAHATAYYSYPIPYIADRLVNWEITRTVRE
jgi:hypothetical protein